MKQLEKIFSKKRNVWIIASVFFVIVFSIILFLCVKLVLMYNNEIKNNKVNLIYEFGPNTVPYAENEIFTADIRERFLSYGISYGVDVSEWQGDIDWQKVKETGISFAMIRCGFRQTHGSMLIEDGQFRRNIEGATAAGLRVGVYFFGTARNEKEALEEAEFTINLIKDYDITYPVVYDIESFDTGRLENVSYSTITDNILTFTEMVGTYGYETMVYSYHNALSYMLDTGKLDGKLIWLAHFADSTNYKGNYSMWQYTNEGRVDGILTDVDLNISYFTYVDEINQIVNNPNYVKPPEVFFNEVDEIVKTKRSTTMRNSPSYDIPNRLGSIPRETQMQRIGISEEFSKVVFNERTIYVPTADLYVSAGSS